MRIDLVTLCVKDASPDTVRASRRQRSEASIRGLTFTKRDINGALSLSPLKAMNAAELTIPSVGLQPSARAIGLATTHKPFSVKVVPRGSSLTHASRLVTVPSLTHGWPWRCR
jgi:hypothetical protein